MTRIGVIADTHGLLRPEVLEIFAGVDHIVHAGDIGGDDILVASHKPLVTKRDGVLHVNPGSAGRRRFSLPVSVGELVIERGRITARIEELQLLPAA